MLWMFSMSCALCLLVEFHSFCRAAWRSLDAGKHVASPWQAWLFGGKRAFCRVFALILSPEETRKKNARNKRIQMQSTEYREQNPNTEYRIQIQSSECRAQNPNTEYRIPKQSTEYRARNPNTEYRIQTQSAESEYRVQNPSTAYRIQSTESKYRVHTEYRARNRNTEHSPRGRKLVELQVARGAHSLKHYLLMSDISRC